MTEATNPKADPVDGVTEAIDGAWDTYRKEAANTGLHDPDNLDPEFAHANGFKAGALYGSNRIIKEIGEVADACAEPIHGLALLKSAAQDGGTSIAALHAATRHDTEPAPDELEEDASQEDREARLRGEIVELVGKAAAIAREIPSGHALPYHVAREILFALRVELEDSGAGNPHAVIGDALTAAREEVSRG